jgi:RNase adaptor protein for sRNA GlmZ degradation
MATTEEQANGADALQLTPQTIFSGVGKKPVVLIVAGSDGHLSKLRKVADSTLKTMSLPNPHHQTKLAGLTGLHHEVQDWLFKQQWDKKTTVGEWADKVAGVFVGNIDELRKNKDFNTYMLCVVCYGGRHRSLAVGWRLATRIAAERPSWSVEFRQAPFSKLVPQAHKPLASVLETDLVFRSVAKKPQETAL